MNCGYDLRESRLTAVLREAIGIDAVQPVRPEIGGVVMLDEAIGTKSTQRLCLQQDGDTLILRTWLAELKPQAKALYRTGRAQRRRVRFEFTAETQSTQRKTINSYGLCVLCVSAVNNSLRWIIIALPL